VSLARETNGGETDASDEDAARSLLHWRYRDRAAPNGSMSEGPWNEVIATILAHRSVRSFLPDPLPPGTLERLVAAASSASTSSNLQTWSVVAVEDPARKARLAEAPDRSISRSARSTSSGASTTRACTSPRRSDRWC